MEFPKFMTKDNGENEKYTWTLQILTFYQIHAQIVEQKLNSIDKSHPI